MSETLIPTMRLRFVLKPEPVEGTGMVSTVRTVRVLQQCFLTSEYKDVWIDVPLVTADRDGAAKMTRCQWCGACVSDDDPCERPSDYCLHNLPTYEIPTNKHTTTDGQLHEGPRADCAACGFPRRDGSATP